MRLAQLNTAIDVKVGERFGVALPLMGATGADWAICSPADVTIVSQETATPSANFGAQLVETVVFACQADGCHEIEFRLGRPWESDAQIDRLTVVCGR